MIRFVLKSAFWLFVLLVGITIFMPLPEDENGRPQEYSAADALTLVKDTIADLGDFCQRNEQTCQTGKSFFSSLGSRARDGAGLLYQFLDRQFSSKEAESPLVSSSTD